MSYRERKRAFTSKDRGAGRIAEVNRSGVPLLSTNLHSRVFTPNGRFTGHWNRGRGGRLASRDEKQRRRERCESRESVAPRGPSRSRSSRSMRCDATRQDTARCETSHPRSLRRAAYPKPDDDGVREERRQRDER